MAVAEGVMAAARGVVGSGGVSVRARVGGWCGCQAGAGRWVCRAWCGVRMCVAGRLAGARVAAVADGGVWGAAAGAMAGGRDELQEGWAHACCV